MSISSSEPMQSTGLRDSATNRLRSGTAPRSASWPLSTDTLSLLHRLASDPDSAPDALKLLHELQVHQVELDLQQVQMESNELESNAELSRYRILYECAPVAYLVLDTEGRILEANLAAANLFGVACEEIQGRTVAALLAPDGAPAIDGLLRSLREGHANASCEIQSADCGNGPRKLDVTAGKPPDGESVLMVVRMRDPLQNA